MLLNLDVVEGFDRLFSEMFPLCDAASRVRTITGIYVAGLVHNCIAFRACCTLSCVSFFTREGARSIKACLSLGAGLEALRFKKLDTTLPSSRKPALTPRLGDRPKIKLTMFSCQLNGEIASKSFPFP